MGTKVQESKLHIFLQSLQGSSVTSRKTLISKLVARFMHVIWLILCASTLDILDSACIIIYDALLLLWPPGNSFPISFSSNKHSSDHFLIVVVIRYKQIIQFLHLHVYCLFIFLKFKFFLILLFILNHYHNTRLFLGKYCELISFYPYSLTMLLMCFSSVFLLYFLTDSSKCAGFIYFVFNHLSLLYLNQKLR